MTLNLWPIMGINVYTDIPIPEMVEQFKHSENDPEYPEEIYRALSKQRSQSTPNVDNRSPSPHSDTSSSSPSKPIRDRGSNVISLF